MKREARLLLRIAIWTVCAFGIISILFPIITVHYIRDGGVEEFEEEFGTSQDEIGGLTLNERTDMFAGSFGLEALNRFSQDPHLKSEGRLEASKIRDHILSGDYQTHLAAVLRKNWYKWPLSLTIASIYVADGLTTGHWKSTQVPGNEDGLYYNLCL